VSQVKTAEKLRHQYGLDQPGAGNHQHAGQNGELPKLILPSDEVSFEQCANECFSKLAKTRKFFIRGRTVVELVRSDSRNILEEVESAAFRSRLEKHFTLMKYRKLPDGSSALKASRCSSDSALALLKTEAALRELPQIRITTNSPIFTESGGELRILQRGYHDVQGGIYVLRNRDIRELPLEEARRSLLGLLEDFNFISESDRSRAAASLISPALRHGGLLKADFPLDLAEANESQSGKTYRQKTVCALYGERPFIINRREESGVGSLDEAISEGLISGQAFLMFENVRGSVASQLLESAIRGEGTVNCRRPYSRGVQIETDRVCWMLSSNRAEMTPDLANRSIITRLRKQPTGYRFKDYPEGDLLAHIHAQTDYYLSCVYSLLCEWHLRGKPRTPECRHDFREWCQTLDWFIQEIFCLPPLVNGHRDEQLRISSPDRGWIRQVALAVEKDNRLEEGLKPAEIADICEAHGLDIPGCRPGTSADQISMQTGKVLKRIFAEEPSIEVGGFRISREAQQEYNQQRQNITVHYHKFESANGSCAPCAPCAPRE
jgi:hypothetical protein